MSVPLILFILFVGVPILEIAAFMQIGAMIGIVPTLFGILLTALIGAWLVRLQGFGVLRDAQNALARNELPVDQLAHGVLILAAGILLMTPGFVTDTFGFLLLVPPLRLRVAKAILACIKGRAEFGVMRSGWGPAAGPDGSGVTIDGEAVEIDDDK